LPREYSVPLQVEKLLESGRMMKTCRLSVLGQLVDQEQVSTSPEKQRKKLSEPNLIYAFIAVVLEPAR
jgi:hypothetical protein